MRVRPDELLVPEEVADLLAVAPTVLREMRKTRSGITYIGLSSRQARYDLRDVVVWLHGVAHRVQAEIETRTAAEKRQRLRLVVSKRTPKRR